MPVSKKDREIIFNKFGGRCAYCGCELTKGWHVDEVEPVRRNRKWVVGHWEEGKPRPKTEQEASDPAFAKWIGSRWVEDGILPIEHWLSNGIIAHTP